MLQSGRNDTLAASGTLALHMTNPLLRTQQEEELCAASHRINFEVFPRGQLPRERASISLCVVACTGCANGRVSAVSVPNVYTHSAEGMSSRGIENNVFQKDVSASRIGRLRQRASTIARAELWRSWERAHVPVISRFGMWFFVVLLLYAGCAASSRSSKFLEAWILPPPSSHPPPRSDFMFESRISSMKAMAQTSTR